MRTRRQMGAPTVHTTNDRHCCGRAVEAFDVRVLDKLARRNSTPYPAPHFSSPPSTRSSRRDWRGSRAGRRPGATGSQRGVGPGGVCLREDLQVSLTAGSTRTFCNRPLGSGGKLAPAPRIVERYPSCRPRTGFGLHRREATPSPTCTVSTRDDPGSANWSTRARTAMSSAGWSPRRTYSTVKCGRCAARESTSRHSPIKDGIGGKIAPSGRMRIARPSGQNTSASPGSGRMTRCMPESCAELAGGGIGRATPPPARSDRRLQPLPAALAAPGRREQSDGTCRRAAGDSPGCSRRQNAQTSSSAVSADRLRTVGTEPTNSGEMAG